MIRILSNKVIAWPTTSYSSKDNKNRDVSAHVILDSSVHKNSLSVLKNSRITLHQVFFFLAGKVRRLFGAVLIGVEPTLSLYIACSRLRDNSGEKSDSGEKSFSKKKWENRAGAGAPPPPPPPFPSRRRFIFALLVLIRPHYTIWEPGTGYILHETFSRDDLERIVFYELSARLLFYIAQSVISDDRLVWISSEW